MTQIQPYASGSSPFDAIRRVRPDGSEYWPARELMNLMAYATWQKFATPIGRAMATARNQGLDVDREFTQVGQFNRSVKPGQQERNDYELSRMAAYLVALNGDPNKPEVAAAQAYFVVRARQAEIKATLTLEGLKDLLADLYRAEHRDELAERGHREIIVSACARVLSFHGHDKPEQSMRAYVQMTIDLGFGDGDTQAIEGGK